MSLIAVACASPLELEAHSFRSLALSYTYPGVGSHTEVVWRLPCFLLD
jgi:hypothetical protein